MGLRVAIHQVTAMAIVTEPAFTWSEWPRCVEVRGLLYLWTIPYCAPLAVDLLWSLLIILQHLCIDNTYH